MAGGLHQIAPKPFAWTPAKRRAVVLVATDDLSDEQIAAEIGCSKRSLEYWKKHPDFAAEVGGKVGELQAAMLRLAIAKKRKRLEVLDDLHSRQLRVIELRAARHAVDADSPEEAARRVLGNHTPPEAATGLLVREETVSASGGVTVKWSFDKGLVGEIRATEEQAAKELGQWVEKSEVGGTVQVVRIVGADVGAI